MTESHGDVALTFVETTTFTRLVTGLVGDDDYAKFQHELAESSDRGDVLVGCGGVRKIRIAAAGRGKSGGARVLYLYLRHRGVIYLLYLFTKGDAANLSADGKKAMRELAHEIKTAIHR